MQRRLIIALVVGCTWMHVFLGTGVALAQKAWEEEESRAELRADFEKRQLRSLLKTGFGSTCEGDYIESFSVNDPNSFDGQTLQDLPSVALPFGLDLNGTKITDQALAELGEQPNLVAIKLNGTEVSDEGIAALRTCKRLEIIDVSGTQVTARGLFHLRGRDSLRLKVDPAVIAHHDFQVFAPVGNRAWELTVTITPEVFRSLRKAGKRHWCRNAGAEEKPRPNSEQEIAKLQFHGKVFGDCAMEDLEDLTHLAHLDFFGSSLGDIGAEKLAKLVSLRWLNLSDSRITDAGVAKLSTLCELSYLNLEGTAITDAGLETVQQFPRLRHVDLSGTSVTAKAVSKLAKIEPLNSIDLRETAISLDELILLANRSEGIRIQLSEDQIRRDKLAAIEWNRLPTWRLNFRISDEVLVSMGEAGLLYCLDEARTDKLLDRPKSNGEVTRMIVMKPGVTDRGAAVVSLLPDLQELRIHAGSLSDSSGEVFGALSQLRKLQLSQAKLMTDQTAAQIGKMTGLEELFWTGSQLTDQGLREIAKLSGLRRLTISGKGVTRDGKNWLQSALPNCEIR